MQYPRYLKSVTCSIILQYVETHGQYFCTTRQTASLFNCGKSYSYYHRHSDIGIAYCYTLMLHSKVLEPERPKLLAASSIFQHRTPIAQRLLSSPQHLDILLPPIVKQGASPGEQSCRNLKLTTRLFLPYLKISGMLSPLLLQFFNVI